MPVAITFPLFFALLFLWHWAYLPALGLFLVALAVSAACVFAVAIALRVRFYRALVRAELTKDEAA